MTRTQKLRDGYTKALGHTARGEHLKAIMVLVQEPPVQCPMCLEDKQPNEDVLLSLKDSEVDGRKVW
jgi:hypothetical protein